MFCRRVLVACLETRVPVYTDRKQGKCNTLTTRVVLSLWVTRRDTPQDAESALLWFELGGVQRDVL